MVSWAKAWAHFLNCCRPRLARLMLKFTSPYPYQPSHCRWPSQCTPRPIWCPCEGIQYRLRWSSPPASLSTKLLQTSGAHIHPITPIPFSFPLPSLSQKWHNPCVCEFLGGKTKKAATFFSVFKTNNSY